MWTLYRYVYWFEVILHIKNPFIHILMKSSDLFWKFPWYSYKVIKVLICSFSNNVQFWMIRIRLVNRQVKNASGNFLIFAPFYAILHLLLEWCSLLSFGILSSTKIVHRCLITIHENIFRYICIFDILGGLDRFR